jgi:glycosyltransferase involved in cell wall biosynthesis
MARIGIDARLATGDLRGVGRVLIESLKRLDTLNGDNEYIIYTGTGEDVDRFPVGEQFEHQPLRPDFYPIYEQIRLPLAARRDGLDLLHCPANTAPILLPDQTKLVLTLHDVIFHHPYTDIPRSSDWYQAVGRRYRRVCTKALQGRIDHCLTVSETSKSDIERTLNIRAPITVIKPGVDESFFESPIVNWDSIRDTYGLRRPYLFHLGGTAPSKNSIAVVETFETLVDRTNHDDITLAIRGVPSDGNPIAEYVFDAGLGDRVVFLPFLSDEELRTVYNQAEIFLLTSLYEGFGLTCLEAMASGTAVIATNRGAVPEVVGDAGVLVDPTDREETYSALKRLLTDEAERRSIAGRGRDRARRFTWAAAAEQLHEVYQDVLNADD